MASSLLYISYFLFDYALLSIEWQTVYAFNPDTEVFALLDWALKAKNLYSVAQPPPKKKMSFVHLNI